MEISELDNLYQLYRFEKLNIKNPSVRVYSFSSKYFSNADIVIINPKVSITELDKIKSDVESLGFSATVRKYATLAEAEEKLFDGFFDIKNSNNQLQKSYKNYTEKIEKVIFGKYKYINSEYYEGDIENLKNDDIVAKIVQDFNTPGPVLIILEAAAGFGKTSTAYEVVNKLSGDPLYKKIPLFTELSRNRQASIFKYVLYDEINRKFTGLNLELVNKHIIEGRIPVIIDGFDELLKAKSIENTEERFEDAEPMLETIKELLKKDAKILLTTRRTAIFSDDDFHIWIGENSSEFSFKKYGILEPTIKDWISSSREKELQKAGLNLKSLSNPVLLGYLRSIDDNRFEECISDIDIIIEDYMIKLMERENERQELKMRVEEQKQILKLISFHFTNCDITSENKEKLEQLIFDNHQQLLYNVLERYPSSERPTIEQLINKLIIHAFLDRKGERNNQIGFVNEFILGSFVGENLIDSTSEWIGTERFVDFLISSYIPRSKVTRKKIYDILNESVLSYLDNSKIVYIDNYLAGGINHSVVGEFITDIEFRSNLSLTKEIKDAVFLECSFFNVNFSKETAFLTGVHFINCKFFDCEFEINKPKNYQFTNCYCSPEFSLSYDKGLNESLENENVTVDFYQKKVLERFWPKGKERFDIHKRMATLRLGVPPEEHDQVNNAILELLKLGYIKERKGREFLGLNLHYINEIKKILQR
jgi:hypothetical protein